LAEKGEVGGKYFEFALRFFMFFEDFVIASHCMTATSVAPNPPK
jgi:hypothetical protein